MKAKLIGIIVSSSSIGALVWAISPMMTGYVEPWDSNTVYYPVALFSGGIALGLFLPGNASIHYLGAFFGQLCFMLVATGAGPLFGIGIVFLAAYTVLFLIGVLAGSKARTKYLEARFPGHDDT